MPPGHIRLRSPEYGPYRSIEGDAKVFGLTAAGFEDVVRRTLAGIASSARLQDCVERTQGGYRFAGIVGLLTVAPGLEVEIPPKFLLPDLDTWQDDLVAMALLGRYGAILEGNDVSGGPSAVRTVSDALGLALLKLCTRHRNKPIRSYRGVKWSSPSIDGELEADAYWELSEDGFEQTSVILSRDNIWNATISHALTILSSEVSSSDISLRLRRQAAAMGVAGWVGGKGRWKRLSLPSRHREWKPTYELAHAIVRGGGLSFSNTQGHVLPGFILRSNETWQEFLGTMLRLSGTDLSVREEPVWLGERFAPDGSGSRQQVRVTPDFRLVDASGQSVAVIDAKYRTRVSNDGSEHLAISASDLYEVLAFLEASQCELGFLVYPTNRLGDRECGSWFVFEEVRIRESRILGIGICVDGISYPGGVSAFAESLRSSVEDNIVQ